ncbi:putative membrane-anchored protein [Roseimicrobium gellanilyticum]|uniref:Putative membrane-anchored protein n=2 Tax=Roseimicrobium gellanilyticum TaxID=748857 RepID=A0A366HIM4_9BACT|nr:putative membrane-anchored protein [Roseimicrobium gellanilyticum]
MKTYLHATFLALGLAAAVPFVQAQTPSPSDDSVKVETGASEVNDDFKKLGAQTEGTGKIGHHAEIEIPEGYVFFPSKGAQELMKRSGNLVNGTEDGLIISDGKGWSVLFEFKNDGYVKDDDKDELNADKMLKAIHENEPAMNERLKEAGLPAQHTVGFAVPPKYNEKTNNLEWATRFTTEGSPGEYVNYNTRLLGRKGVMEATLMVDPDKLEASLPDYQKLLTGYRFVQGETYAEYRQGDKLASYTIGGLVVGGGAFAAAKMGLFAKFFAVLAKGGKAVFAGIAVVVAVIGKFVGKLFGRRDQSQFNQ